MTTTLRKSSLKFLQDNGMYLLCFYLQVQQRKVKMTNIQTRYKIYQVFCLLILVIHIYVYTRNG